MGDIGQSAQAAASVTDTAMTDTLNMYEDEQNRRFDAEQAGAQRDWSAQQAQLARTFDASQQSSAQKFAASQQVQAENYNTQMSDTAMQRRVADLKAAGLNPLLSMGSLGGASAPMMSAPGSPAIGGPAASGGAAASMNSLPNIQPLTQGLQGVLTAQKQRDLLDAQTKDTNAAGNTKIAELPWAAAAAEAGYNNLVATREQLMAQVRTLSSQFDYNEANSAKLMQDKDFAAQLQPLLVKAAQLENQGKQYGLASLATQSAFWSSPLAGAYYAAQQAHGYGGDLAGALTFAAQAASRVQKSGGYGASTGANQQQMGYGQAVGQALGDAE